MQFDNAWVLLFILFAYTSRTDPDFYNKLMKQLEDEKKQIEQEKWLTENCECIEWEQDMNANIPFCKLDGKICNFQCLGKKATRPLEMNQDFAKLIEIMRTNYQNPEKCQE